MATIPMGFYSYGNLPDSYVPAHTTDKVGQRCGNCSYYDAGFCHEYQEHVVPNFISESWSALDPLERGEGQ
tara:strand:+ start:1210 stop:1422 length:213 start_codon:yes stop_codon:yes gene_type:complete